MDETTRGGVRRVLHTLMLWAAKLPTVWLVVLIGGVVTGVAVAAYGGFTVYDYTMNNPPFCPPRPPLEAGPAAGAPAVGGDCDAGDDTPDEDDEPERGEACHP